MEKLEAHLVAKLKLLKHILSHVLPCYPRSTQQENQVFLAPFQPKFTKDFKPLRKFN